MAIHPLSPAPVDPTPPNTQSFATSGITLTIPLDVNPEPQPSTAKARRAAAASTERRDSLKRREALLRGKEGSRRRQRWENGTWHIFTLALLVVHVLMLCRSLAFKPPCCASFSRRLGA